MLNKLLQRGSLRVSELETVTAQERLRLLQWIGRCMSASGSHSFMTPEGVRIRLSEAQTTERTVLRAEDGDLEMANYELHFMLTEAAAEAAVGRERQES